MDNFYPKVCTKFLSELCATNVSKIFDNIIFERRRNFDIITPTLNFTCTSLLGMWINFAHIPTVHFYSIVASNSAPQYAF